MNRIPWDEYEAAILLQNAFIAIFKIIANIRMNETTLNSQKTIHFEGRVESRLEEHPVSML